MSSRLMFVFVIHDRVADYYDTPVCFVNEATAVRWFADSIRRIPAMANNPQDYTLLSMGVFDPDTGLIQGSETLSQVINGLNCVESDQLQRVQENENTSLGDEPSVQPST